MSVLSKIDLSKRVNYTKAAIVFLVVALVGYGAWYWFVRDQKPEGIQAQQVTEMSKKFPTDYQVGTTTTIVDDNAVSALSTPPQGAEVRPETCGAASRESASRLLGASAYTVNALNGKLIYIITSQEIPKDKPPRGKEDSKNCRYSTMEFPDGRVVVSTPADKPATLDGVEVKAVRTVSRSADGVVEDGYTYSTWIDDRHAVTLVVKSDPTAKPVSTPVDPGEAQRLFSEAVKIVANR